MKNNLTRIKKRIKTRKAKIPKIFKQTIMKPAKKSYKKSVKLFRKRIGGLPKISHHYKGAVAGAVIVSILASLFVGGNAQAATYVFTQSGYTGGVSATTATHASNRDGWNKYSALSGTAVSGDGTSVSLSPASASFTETFSTDVYKDGASTTGNWNTTAGAFQMASSAGSSMSSLATAIGNVLPKFAIDEANGILYIISSGGTKFWKHNLSTGVTTELTSRLSSLSVGSFNSIVFDSTSTSVFIGGTQAWDDGYDAGTLTAIFKYSPSTDQASAAYVDSSGHSDVVYAMALDDANRMLYFGSWPAFLGRYSIQSGSTTDLSSKISSFWANGTVKSVAMGDDGVVYLGSSGGKFAKYTASSNTAADLTSGISSHIGVREITSLVYETANGEVYLGAGGGKFAKYSPSSNSDLTSGISSFWGVNSINDMALGPNNELYLGGSAGKFAKYSISSSTATDLTSSISSFVSTNFVTQIRYDASSGYLYLSANGGKFGNIPPACSTCVAQSLAVDSTSQNIASATLTKNDTGSVAYFLSNDGGANWTQVTPGAVHTFATTGSDLRFKAELVGSASVQDISISYDSYPSAGTLTGSIFDTEDAENVMGGISWTEDASLPAGTTVSMALRTGSTPEAVALASWSTAITSATSGCVKTEGSVVCDSTAIPASMRAGGDDRYFQYQMTLGSTGVSTATVSGVSVTYVVNARPEFNAGYPDPEAPGSGVVASQVSLEGSENLGKIFIQYSVRDTDTTLGSSTPGYITPSFEYDIGGGWVAVNSAYLREADVENKSVDVSAYSDYSALWDARSQIPGQYSATAKIRVTINDNEGANNTATAESPSFVLDTSDPAISSVLINSSTDSIHLSATDNAVLQYRLANSADYSDAGAWVSVGASSMDSDITDWTLPGGAGAETVYVQVKDTSGNIASSSAVAPAVVANLDLRDVGNALTAEFREFLAWGLYANTDGATFASYEVYRSTDSTNYSLLTTITDINQNYYTDSSVTNLDTYSYKIIVVDSDGDRSNYSAIVSDTPDGQGGTDFTAPTVSDVEVAEIQTTWARITWTTDEISNSIVEYAAAPTNTFGSSKTSSAMVTSHSLVVDGLSPNTEYAFRVKSTDVLSNIGSDDNNGEAYTFTTGGGPEISGVAVRTVDDNTATIVWNTDRSANSYVVFGGEVADLDANTDVNTVGSAEYVAEPYEHQVTLTGLLPRTTYYFYVKSTDQESGYESIDNREGRYYNFNTTNDQKAPTISDIETPIIASTAVSITWRTDELADSVVEYGTVEGTYDQSSSLDSTMSIYHVITLNGLEPETEYFIKVKSTDSADNTTEATSSFRTVTGLQTVYVGGGGGSAGTILDTTPPRLANIEVSEESSFGATIRFETDEDTIGFINFGDEAQYNRSIGSSAFNVVHEIKLFGLRSGTDYNFEVKVFDEAGNMGASTNRTFKTKFASEMLDEMVILDNMEEFQEKIEGLIESTLPSLIPPVINEIEVTNVSDTSADVSWKTNVKSFSTVALVKGDEFDPTVENPYKFEMSNVEEKVKEHKLSVQSLEPGTKYHFQVKSFSIPGVIGKSKDYNFATRAMNAKAGAIQATNNSFTLSWQTADPTTSFVEYKNLKTGKVAEMGNKDLTKNHIVEVGNLPAATPFEVTYYGYTADGVKIEGSAMRVTTLIDNKAPILNDVSISSAFIPYRPNQLQTLISWKTDEPASSVVEYEEGPGSAETLANKTGEDTELTKEHIVILPGFKPGTIYRVRISSEDSAGNVGIVPTRTIITPVASDTVFEIIINNFEDVFGFLKNVR